MATSLKLEMPTGNGNTALAANCGTINPIYQPLLDIALKGQQFGNYNGAEGAKVASSLLDPAIESLRTQRNEYQVLTPVQQEYRPQVLDFCIQFRDKCREHPQALLYVVP